MNYETNKQIADQTFQFEPSYYRTSYDKQYLSKYDHLSLNANTFPSLNESNMNSYYGVPTSLNIPENMVKENYNGVNYRKEGSLQETYSPCMNCLSIYNTKMNRTSYDKQYDDKYNNISMNVDTNFAPSKGNKGGLWNANQ
jgi:hypothetical protein